MISLRGLSLEGSGAQIDALSLEVADGEIYSLLTRPGGGDSLLFRALNGSQAPLAGEVLYDGRSLDHSGPPLPAAFVDRVGDVSSFETEARLGDWIDLLCAGCGLSRASVFQTLLVLNFHEASLKKRVRELPPEVFQQAYLAACLAPGSRNIVIRDFIRGATRGFELKFNKLLLQQKAQGRAVLSLGSDIFSASEIADRVGFVKGGRLLFEALIDDLKEMDVQDLYLRFLS